MLSNLSFVKIKPTIEIDPQIPIETVLQDGVRFTETEADLRASYQLRHKIYVEGMNRFSDKSNHALKELQDENDKNARAVIAIKKNKPIGTLRLFWGGDTEFTEEQKESYHLSMFSSILEDKNICIVERLMIDNSSRGSLTILRLYREVMNFVLENQVEVVLLNCEPHLMSSYLKLGFRPFAKQTNYPGFGPVTPMALIVGNYKYLKSIGSSFAMLLNEESLNHCSHVTELQETICTDSRNTTESSANKESEVINFFAARKKLLTKRTNVVDSRLKMKLSAC